MVERLKISSQNCRGLNNTIKRKKVFQFLKKKKSNIYCLQDVHCTPDQEQLIKQQWGYKECFFSCYKSNARGTAILFNNNFEFEIIHTVSDEEGNFVALKFKSNEIIYTIISIYGPNKDEPEFFDRII